MRIALVTDVFLPKVDGVVTRLLRTLDALGDLGHDVLVLTPGTPPDRYGPHRVARARSFTFPWYPEIRAGVPTPAAERALTAFRPDVVHAVNPVWFGAWGALAARRRDLPLLASFHTDVPQYMGALGYRIAYVRWVQHPRDEEWDQEFEPYEDAPTYFATRAACEREIERIRAEAV